MLYLLESRRLVICYLSPTTTALAIEGRYYFYGKKENSCLVEFSFCGLKITFIKAKMKKHFTYLGNPEYKRGAS